MSTAPLGDIVWLRNSEGEACLADAPEVDGVPYGSLVATLDERVVVVGAYAVRVDEEVFAAWAVEIAYRCDFWGDDAAELPLRNHAARLAERLREQALAAAREGEAVTDASEHEVPGRITFLVLVQPGPRAEARAAAMLHASDPNDPRLPARRAALDDAAVDRVQAGGGAKVHHSRQAVRDRDGVLWVLCWVRDAGGGA